MQKKKIRKKNHSTQSAAYDLSSPVLEGSALGKSPTIMTADPYW